MSLAVAAPQVRESRRQRPARVDVEAAVRLLIEWTGDDPDREGLIDTPARVVRAYEAFFEGYKTDPADILARTFEETNDYDDVILLRNMRLESHCEHHILPIIGKAHVAYRSCFYRAVSSGLAKHPIELTFTEVEKAFDPKRVYGDAPNPTQL